MPGGIAASAGLHIGLFLLILLGLPSLFRPPPPQDMPIAVDLVTIAPETRATQPNPFKPKPETKPEPAVAAPAPKPEPKPEPPAAAEPPSAAAPPPPLPAPPQPKPEIKPTPAPPPPPPKPVAAQAPPPPPPPETKPRPQPQRVAHHVPRAEPKKSDPAAFEKVLNNLQDKKPAPAFDSLLKNLTRDQVAPADEAPRQHQRVTAAAPPSSQPKAPLGAQLTASEMDLLREQLHHCWNVPSGVRDAKDLVIEVRVTVGPDGIARQAMIVDQGRLGDPIFRAAAESARRTFFNPECTPLRVPAGKYELWKDLVVDFSPKDLL
jgi:hypothetical protein